MSQAVALEDTHLMVIKRKSVEAIINKGKKLDRTRWHITKRQLDKCRRIFNWDPSVRNILDLKMVMESTVNCEFFQNMPLFMHLELCKHAKIQRVEPGQEFFKDLQHPVAFFALVLRGRVSWSYYDNRRGYLVRFFWHTRVSALGVVVLYFLMHAFQLLSHHDLSFLGQDVELSDSGYLFGVGTARNKSDETLEVVVILRQHWDKASRPDEDDGDGQSVHEV